MAAVHELRRADGAALESKFAVSPIKPVELTPVANGSCVLAARLQLVAGQWSDGIYGKRIAAGIRRVDRHDGGSPGPAADHLGILHSVIGDKTVACIDLSRPSPRR